jgi:hypothetical protein
MTKEDFIKGSNGYGSHRPLLWEALQATKESKRPILELGAGENSTPFIRAYCLYQLRSSVHYDSNKKWAEKMNAKYCPDWDYLQWFYMKQYSVVLVDEAPGEHRKTTLEMFAWYPVHFEILVVHDSEPPGWNASDYQVRPLFSKFKYVKDDIPKEKGQPWTTALSQTIDVTKFNL